VVDGNMERSDKCTARGLKSNVMAHAMLQKKTVNKNHRKTEKLLYE
jgi:hypothetical protein